LFIDEDLEAYVHEEVRRQTAEWRGGNLSAPSTAQIPTAFTRFLRRKAMTPQPLKQRNRMQLYMEAQRLALKAAQSMPPRHGVANHHSLFERICLPKRELSQ
jgi:hypothetical protein